MAMPMAGNVIRGVAYASYTLANDEARTVYSNDVHATVKLVEEFSLTPNQMMGGYSSTTVTFRHVLKNVGNGPSDYRFFHDDNGCDSAPRYMPNARLYLDVNSNGEVDSADREIAWRVDSALQLKPAAAVNLLFQVDVPPSLTTASYCERLVVDTGGVQLQKYRHNRLRITPLASLHLSNSVELTASRGSGVNALLHRVHARNVGRMIARPTPYTHEGAWIHVDGVNRSLILLRGPLHSGEEYLPDSLHSSDASAVLLYRLKGDAPYSYRSSPGELTTNVVEVAVGLERRVAVDESLSFGFSTRLRSKGIALVQSQAEAIFNNSSIADMTVSNLAMVRTLDPLGLSVAASAPYANVDAEGNPDGTGTVRFSMVARNYHPNNLYGLRITNPLEHMADGLGRYTSAALPGPGEYTVVAESLRIVAQQGSVTVAQIAPEFTGQETHAELLSNHAVLASGGMITVQFDVRFYLADRSPVLYNSAVATASLAPGGDLLTVSSVNGLDPDFVSLGNLEVLAQSTPYSSRPPVVWLGSGVSAPQPVPGVPDAYDLEVVLSVLNDGADDVNYLRLVANLDCGFEIGSARGLVQSWKLLHPPFSEHGRLTPSPSFTGQGVCDGWDPATMDTLGGIPLQPELAIADGPIALPKGASDNLYFTVRVFMKPGAADAGVALSLRFWVGVLQPLAQAPVGQLPGRNDGKFSVLWAAFDDDSSSHSTPTGVVYNAVTRLPVADARVILSRQACQGSSSVAIDASEMDANNRGVQTFHADGSVSMLTDESGQYHFALDPQVSQDLCTYSLHVEAPPGSNLRFPSAQILAQAGAFSACGAVAPTSAAPQQGQDAHYFQQLVMGTSPGSDAVCHAFNNHLPLDPEILQGLRLQKKASVTTVELGDLLSYTLTVSNDTAQVMPLVLLEDDLPAGFQYIPGSARLNGQVQPNPQGGVGPRLVFQILALGAGATAELRYQVRVGVGASVEQDAVNRAWASTGDVPTSLRSNEADARVHVVGGVFSDDAFAFGKVFMDCNRNGLQDASEAGIPGVQLFMEDGVGVDTDSEGKWSLYGLRPITHVLRLDVSTLPAGSELARMGNRQGQQLDSVFLDLRRGEWKKANFAVVNCDNARVRQEVQARRDALRAQPGLSDDGARASVRLALDSEQLNQVPSRYGPAAGTVESRGANRVSAVPASALIALQEAPAVVVPPLPLPALSLQEADRTVRQVIVVAPAATESAKERSLEEVVQEVDTDLAFLNLHDQQLLASVLANVRIKGPAGSKFVLLLNGVPVDEARVGKRVRIDHQQIEAWEFIAVQFAPGANALELQERDAFGNVRGVRKIQVHAPGALAHVALDIAVSAPADASRPVVAVLRLLDANQLPVMERTAITLEVDGARWDVTDMNPHEPGVQWMVEGGRASLALIPPSQPGDGRVRVSAGVLQTEAKIIFLPDLRPLTGVGILEGIVRFNPASGVPMGAARAGDAFESELRAWSYGSADEGELAGRSAFYFKGAVKGEYLLTLAYDNDKRTAFRMFRDIQPDKYYPIYGDSSIASFDAQSSQRLYVRVDKDRSYLLFGDHNTQSSPEVRKLSQVAHNATGVKHVYNQQGVRISSHVSHDALKQYVEEFPANGTSGPYALRTPGDLFANSEIVQVVVRDRNQPNSILRTTQLIRFAQYNIEPLSKTVLFSAPVASLDADFNPQSIRITSAVDEGGASFWTGGVDLQYTLTEQVQLGGVVEYEGTPDKGLQLSAATMLAKIGSETVLRAEAVGTQSDLYGHGQGLRLQLEDSVGSLKYEARLHSSDAGFHNPYSGVAAGQTDLAARADYTVSEGVRVKTDLAYTRVDAAGDLDSGVRTQGAGIALQQVLTPSLTSEVGLRSGRSGLGTVAGFDYSAVSSIGGVASTGSGMVGASAEDYVSARARLTFQPLALPQMQLFVEGEQDVNDASRQLYALGGNYAITPKTRLYGRYEALSSAGNTDALSRGGQRNIGLLGIDSTYMEGGRVYDELRIADTMDGRAVQSAMGVRNSWAVTEGLRLSGGLEQVSAVPGSAGNIAGDSRAWTGAYDWLGQKAYLRRLRASGTAEWREGSDSHSRLLSSGLAYKWDRNWSILARGIFSRVNQLPDGVVHDKRRGQIGLAYRPVDQDVWNALWRYEHKVDQRHAAQSAALSPAPAHTVTDVVSTHLNYQPTARDHYSARVALRSSKNVLDALHSRYGASLWQGRWTRDLDALWDLGLQAGLWADDQGSTRYTLGAEAGYQLGGGIWLSIGYNALGLRDPDLSGADYLDTGLYLRLRFKFDERLFLSDADASESMNRVD